MRKLFILVLLAHAFMHLPGLAGAWGWHWPSAGLSAASLAGAASAKTLGLAWLFAALALATAALAAAQRWPGWSALALTAPLPSLLLCLLFLPECGPGAAVDFVLLFTLSLGLHRRWAWLDPPPLAL